MAKDSKPMGPIAFTIGADPKTKMVIMGFNSAVNRVEIDPATADALAATLIDRAKVARGEIQPGTTLKEINKPESGFGDGVDPNYEMPEG